MIGPLTNLQIALSSRCGRFSTAWNPSGTSRMTATTTGGNSSAWEMPKLKTVPWFRCDTSLRGTRRCASSLIYRQAGNVARLDRRALDLRAQTA